MKYADLDLSSVRSRTVSSEDLLTSAVFDETNFYQQFQADLAACQESVWLESPFITSRRVATLVSSFQRLVNRGIKVQVDICRPVDVYKTWPAVQSAERAVQLLEKIGVVVNQHQDYRHRKLAVLDNLILWSGSLNILSHGGGGELMHRFESRYYVNQTLKALDRTQLTFSRRLAD